MPVVFAAGPIQHIIAEQRQADLERRLFKLGQRTGVLHTPALNEPSDQGAYEGGEDIIRFHTASNSRGGSRDHG